MKKLALGALTLLVLFATSAFAQGVWSDDSVLLYDVGDYVDKAHRSNLENMFAFHDTPEASSAFQVLPSLSLGQMMAEALFSCVCGQQSVPAIHPSQLEDTQVWELFTSDLESAREECETIGQELAQEDQLAPPALPSTACFVLFMPEKPLDN